MVDHLHDKHWASNNDDSVASPVLGTMPQSSEEGSATIKAARCYLGMYNDEGFERIYEISSDWTSMHRRSRAVAWLLFRTGRNAASIQNCPR